MRLLSESDLPLYVAVDPGGVTGVAWYVDGQFGSAEVPGGDLGFAPFWRDVLEQFNVAHLVCETFTITPATASKTRQYDALYIIGWLRSECGHLGLPLTMQSPSTGKSFATDAKLRHLGWYDRTPGGHRNDAARHLLTFLAKRGEPAILKRLGEML
jgi:hypothetical protein